MYDIADEVVDKLKSLFYPKNDMIPLHEPFFGNEKKYINECIDTTFVSSVGKFVDKLETEISKYTNVKYVIATVNGTSALHISLLLAGVKKDDEVLVSPYTFVGTVNAIKYTGASPLFIDIEEDTLGLCPFSLKKFLENNTTKKNGNCINKITGKRISAILPVHIYGHPCKIDKILSIADNFNIPVIEDAAEALGSFYKNKHLGSYGLISSLSFNGNKIVTTGGGGAILTNNVKLAKQAKHITTTSKLPHKWAYIHDEVGFNYRMPNLNAALGLAQIENIEYYLLNKRKLFKKYKKIFLI